MKTIASFLVLAWLLLATAATVCAQNVAGDVAVPKDVAAVPFFERLPPQRADSCWHRGCRLRSVERVNLHDVGHGKGFGSLSADEIRRTVRTQHMALINKIITRLKEVPEADGNMFDNTMLFYFPDNGETHHSTGIEWPFVVFSGRNAKLDIAGRYIRLPHYGEEGHQTLGNWYTTLLNAYGNSIEHYGELDVALEKMKRNQKGPISQFM